MTNNRLEFYILSSFALGGDTGKDLFDSTHFFFPPCLVIST